MSDEQSDATLIAEGLRCILIGVAWLLSLPLWLPIAFVAPHDVAMLVMAYRDRCRRSTRALEARMREHGRMREHDE